MVVEARGLRSSSRRTPQPPLPSAASADPRTTRGRSQDINPMQQASPLQRTTRGQARATSVESALSTGSAPRGSRRMGKQAAAAPELPTVEEDALSRRHSFSEPPATEDQTSANITIFSSAQEHQPEPEFQPEGSPGDKSNRSESPISNAETLDPPSDLDVVLMVDSLEDMHADANKVLEKISPKNANHAELRSIYSDVRKPGSNLNRILAKRLERFEGTQARFGNEEYIRCDTVNAAFAGKAALESSINPLPRSDAILQKANLASLAMQMIALEREKSETYDILLRLDNTFPRNFLSGFYGNDSHEAILGESHLLEETFSLALEIRSQFAIRLLSQNQDDPKFWPHQELLEVFFMPVEEDHQANAGHRPLRGWDVPGLASDNGELPQHFQHLVLEQVEKIRKCLPDEEGIEDVDFELLEAEFPWTQFIIKLLEWISKRKEETEAEILDVGGVEAIQSALQGYFESSADQEIQPPNPLSQSQPMDAKPQPKTELPPPNPGVISVLKKRIARLSGGQTRETVGTALQPRQPRQPEFQDDWQPTANEDEDISATAVEIQEQPTYASKQGAMEQLRRIERQNKENILRVQNENAKRSIFERQPDALRVPFDEDGIRNSPVKTRGAPSQSPAKRRRVGEDDYDEEFETDQRQPSSQRRREALAKRRRITTAPRRATSISSSRGPQIDGNDDVGGETVVEDVDEVRRLARRQGTAMPPVTNSGGKRKRFPWTEEEDRQFLALYRIFGGNKQPWKRIKEADEADLNVLHRRDPVALKDRARNVCFIFDKANTGRPDVFEGHGIGEYYKRKVEQKLGRLPSGIPVDQ